MSPSIAEAERLAAEGDFRAAMHLLSVANRVRRDRAVESRLVELRRDAAAVLAPSTRPRRWPPKVRDIFGPDVVVPEVGSDALTPEVLRSGVLRHGCLLVRRLVPSPRVAQLVEDIDRAFDAHDCYVNGTASAATAPWFVPFEPQDGATIPREWIRGADGVLAVDSPRSLFDVIEAFEEAGIGELVTNFLAEAPVLLATKWTLRRIPPRRDFARDFHQDGAFLGHGIRTLNAWVSLSHCGLDAPGLDIVARRFERIIGAGSDDAIFDWSITEASVRRLAGSAIVRPVFTPGDVLFFDHMLPHRTASEPDMVNTRYAVEAWFAAPSGYPETGVPLLY